MSTNLDRFKNDLQALIDTGRKLQISMKLAANPEKIRPQIEAAFKEKTEEFIKKLPLVVDHYQRWYSEALALLQQLLPDRVQDFVRHYEKPKARKAITSENYSIEDYLQG